MPTTSELPNTARARPPLFPHRYSVAARARSEGDVALESERLPPLVTAPLEIAVEQS